MLLTIVLIFNVSALLLRYKIRAGDRGEEELAVQDTEKTMTTTEAQRHVPTEIPVLPDEDNAPGLPSTSDRATMLRLENVSVFYGTNKAVNAVSMDVYKNQVTALIGPSGCGKSTLLRCLNRMNDLIPAARVEGQIYLDGVDILSKAVDPVQIRRRVGMVFQKPNPFPMSIKDNVAFGPRRLGLAKRNEIDDLVERSLRQAAIWDEVKDKLDTPGTALSGGQQQRLCIARVLAVQPEVILMDEPCSALDPIATLRIEELMQRAREELHDRHRHPQHAAGSPRQPLDGLHACGRGAHRGDGRVRRHARHLHQPEGQAHGGLHHRPLRLRLPSRGSTLAGHRGVQAHSYSFFLVCLTLSGQDLAEGSRHDDTQHV